MKDIKNATISVGRMTLRRPFVSAKNPHKCEEQIMPKKAAAPRIPFSLVVKFKSHWETGRTNVMPTVSKIKADMIKPQLKINM